MEMGQIGRRGDARLRVDLPAQLTTLDGHPRAILCDISQSGAHVHCNPPLEKGEELVLEWLGYEAFGKVVWVCGRDAGISFYDRISPETLLATRDRFDRHDLPDERIAIREAARAWCQGRKAI